MGKTAAVLIVLAATLGTTTFAKTPIDRIIRSTPQVSLHDAITVPLLTAPSGAPHPCVKVNIDDRDYVFALSTGADATWVSDRVVFNHNLRVIGNRNHTVNLTDSENLGSPRPITRARLEHVQIGEMRVENLRVRTDNTPLSPFFSSLRSGVHLDGIISLSSLGVAWRIEPSDGTVTFLPASDGSVMLEAFGGDVVETQTRPATVWDGETDVGDDNHLYSPSIHQITQLIISDRTMTAALQLGSSVNHLSTVTRFSDAPQYTDGSGVHTFHSVRVHNLNGGSAWFTYNDASPQTPRGLPGFPDAFIGDDILFRFDIAANASASQLALRMATGQHRQDPLPILLADALAATQHVDQHTSTPTRNAAVAWRRLGDVYSQQGDLKHALDAYQRLVKAPHGERNCDNWRLIGHTQWAMGDLLDAKIAFIRSSELYHEWWDNPPEVRRTIRAQMLRRSPADQVAHAQAPQPVRCHKVDGELAQVLLAMGDHNGVFALYEDRLDRDPRLALVAGNAALVTGDIARAQMAYRQSVRLETTPDPGSRMGLAMTHQATGDWDSAQDLYTSAVAMRPENIMNLQIWIDAVSQHLGSASAVRTAEAFVNTHPGSLAGHIALARASRVAGPGHPYRGIRFGDAAFAEALSKRPLDPTVHAAHALFLVETSRLREASHAATLALAQQPNNAVALLAMANIHLLLGDIPVAHNFLRDAAQAKPANPGMAMLVNSTASPTSSQPADSTP